MSDTISSSAVVSAELPVGKDVIGFHNISKQIHKKVIKQGFDFTLLVAGGSGLGKSTFINTLFVQDLYKDRLVPSAAELMKKTVNIEKRTVQLEEFGVKLRLSVIDTPGYGDSMDDSESWKVVHDYLEDQFESYFQAENSVHRKNITDTRVHCCIYFITPNGYGLRKHDIEFMKNLQHLVNIIPVIAKADTLTRSELQRLKTNIKRDILAQGIEVYNYSLNPQEPEEIDDASKRWNRELYETMPFAIIGGNTPVEIAGRRVRARVYPWGIIEIDNQNHCDFHKLREMVVSTHMHDLTDTTYDVHYENFRARRLLTPHNYNKTRKQKEERHVSENLEAKQETSLRNRHRTVSSSNSKKTMIYQIP